MPLFISDYGLIVTLALFFTVSEIWPVFHLERTFFLPPSSISINFKFENVFLAMHRPNFVRRSLDTGLIICARRFPLKPTRQPGYICYLLTDGRTDDRRQPYYTILYNRMAVARRKCKFIQSYSKVCCHRPMTVSYCRIQPSGHRLMRNGRKSYKDVGLCNFCNFDIIIASQHFHDQFWQA